MSAQSQKEYPVRTFFHSNEIDSGVESDAEASLPPPHQEVENEGDNIHGVAIKLSEKTKRPKNAYKRKSVLGNWGSELTCLLIASALLGSVAIILSKRNNERQSKWNGITLSALIAIISTIFRASMMTAVEEVIGQMKWAWYKRSRPLWHLSIFDSATRGPWGSALMLFRLKAITFAHIGCLVTVLSLATGPFMQQALHLEDCSRPARAPKAWTGRGWNVTDNFGPSISVTNGIGNESTYERGLDYAIKGALINNFAGLKAVDKKSLIEGCLRGNCTFPKRIGDITHSTFGVCSVCRDATKYLREDASRKGIFLPNNHTLFEHDILGMHLGAVDGEPSDLSWVPDLTDSIRRAALVNWTMIIAKTEDCKLWGGKPGQSFDNPRCDYGPVTFSSRPFQSFNSAACTLYPCTKYFSAKVEGRDLFEDIVLEIPTGPIVNQNMTRTEPGPGPQRWTEWRYNITKQNCTINETMIDFSEAPITRIRPDGSMFVDINGVEMVVPPHCVEGKTGDWLLGFSDFLRSSLNGFCRPGTGKSNKVTCGLNSDQKNDKKDGMKAWWLIGTYIRGNFSHEYLPKYAHVVADTFTVELRKAAPEKGTNPVVYGTEWVTAICTKFRWPWLMLPASLLLLAGLLLATIAIDERFDEDGQPIWKNSILPPVYAGSKFLTKSVDEKEASDSVTSLEEAARRLKARLVMCPHTGQWKLLIDDRRHVVRDSMAAIIDSLIGGL